MFNKKDKPLTYIDPFNLSFPDVGNLILITNADEHHCSPETVKWLRKGGTVIIAPQGAVDLFHGGDVHCAEPGKQFEVKGAVIDVVPAFTGVGYVISYQSGTVIYHCGHTVGIKKLPEIPIDVFLFNFGAHADLDLIKASELVNQVNSAIAIPLHWDKSDQDKSDAVRFKRECAK